MLRKPWRTFVLICTTAALVGCAAAPLVYGPSDKGGPGYFERQRDVYKWVVGSYYQTGDHTPQQAANILMQRAAEIAVEGGFSWMRILNYQNERRRGTDSMPGVIDLKGGAIYPGVVYEVNLDEKVSDSQFRREVSIARVEYFEFSRGVDCQRQSCSREDFQLEACRAGGDGGAQDLIAKCSIDSIARIYGDHQRCVDTLRFVTKDYCKNVMNAAFGVHGFVEERKVGNVGDWFKAEDVLRKYKERSQQWASEARRR